mmetsp:Transcript_27284/g.70665  ORF Transcript_27284/g.70665 Transcript_27284/m.70665 type:complete len:219 (+) Transcript_27284:137-793(+)
MRRRGPPAPCTSSGSFLLWSGSLRHSRASRPTTSARGRSPARELPLFLRLSSPQTLNPPSWRPSLVKHSMHPSTRARTATRSQHPPRSCRATRPSIALIIHPSGPAATHVIDQSARSGSPPAARASVPVLPVSRTARRRRARRPAGRPPRGPSRPRRPRRRSARRSPGPPRPTSPAAGASAARASFVGRRASRAAPVSKRPGGRSSSCRGRRRRAFAV